MYIERKTIRNGNPLIKEWISVDEWIHDPYFEISEVRNRYWTYRNYLLFAILANVRNHYNIQPISQPKGLPEDVSHEVKKQSDEENGDAHTRSWLTLKELLEYDWQQKFEDNNNEIVPLEAMVIPFVNEFIPRLSEIDVSENVRMVFWFDN
ncbi:hypothetical protein [Paenibacillus sp. CCS19]|uniref:hypothetical protein n=1 Tax=Paenibacillus sp. CCS19 TaxID=3158387 RepID=UPI00295ED19C|nr:hypothetical protein [Paenibacillus cellulosilyticus]